MYFGIPQVILCAVLVFGLGIEVAKHGETSEHNFWYSLISTVIWIVLLLTGGFFTK